MNHTEIIYPNPRETSQARDRIECLPDINQTILGYLHYLSLVGAIILKMSFPCVVSMP